MKTLLIILLLLIPYLTIGQINFYKTYTGSAFDEGQGVTQILDSSYAVTGSSGAFSTTSGQAYLMLVDSLGNHLWTKSYGGDGSDWGRRIFHKPGEGFVIAGYTNTTDDGTFNFYIIETDEFGELISEKNFGTSNWERLWDAVMLNDDGLILVGETEGESSDLKDMYIARTDSQGDTLWTKTISTQFDDIAYAVDIVDDTTIVIGGDSWENEKPRSTIVNMHINGEINWQKFYGDTVETGIRDLKYYDDNIYAGGYLVPINKTDRDFWMLKTEANGDFTDDFLNELDGDDFISSIVVKDATGLYVSIISDSQDLGVFAEGTDAFIQKFHTDLYFNGFSKSYSGVNSDISHQMINTIDNGVAFTGTCGDNRVEPSSGTDVMLVKIGPNDEAITTADNGNDLVNLSSFSEEENFVVFPNPTTEKLYLPEIFEGKRYLIYNSLGSEIQRGEVANSIDVKHFDPGIYHLNVIHDNNYSSIRFVKK